MRSYVGLLRYLIGLIRMRPICYFLMLAFLGLCVQVQRHFILFSFEDHAFSPVDNAVKKAAASRLHSPKITPLFNSSEGNLWKRELFARLDRIRESCGDLCTINDKTSYESRIVAKRGSLNNSSFATMVVPHVNCPAIIGNADIDASDYTFPDMPEELLSYFTVGGMMDFQLVDIMRNAYQSKEAKMSTWSFDELQRWKQLAMTLPDTSLRGTYGKVATFRLREKLRRLNVTNKSVLVIGSERPWVEAVCLGLGAARVTTLEYGRINCTHPQVQTLTPQEFREHYHNGTLGEFDVVVSHSSLEHSGLGRYGDALNPWSDILALARAWCVTKPGGGLYLGLPTGKDDILHNAGRVYGPVRWPLVTMNWQQIDGDGHKPEEFMENHRIVDKKRYGGKGFLFRRLSVAKFPSVFDASTTQLLHG